MASINIDTARRNLDRAERAHRALEAYGLPEHANGLPEQDYVTEWEAHQVLGDLLCDLQHWGDVHGIHWPSVTYRADNHYEAEMEGE